MERDIPFQEGGRCPFPWINLFCHKISVPRRPCFACSYVFRVRVTCSSSSAEISQLIETHLDVDKKETKTRVAFALEIID